MIIQRMVKKDVAVDDRIKCDICKKEYKYADEEKMNDQLEAQEFIKIRQHGGYSSIFGDNLAGFTPGVEPNISYDICQHCFYKWLKDNGVLKEENKK